MIVACRSTIRSTSEEGPTSRRTDRPLRLWRVTYPQSLRITSIAMGARAEMTTAAVPSHRRIVSAFSVSGVPSSITITSLPVVAELRDERRGRGATEPILSKNENGFGSPAVLVTWESSRPEPERSNKGSGGVQKLSAHPPNLPHSMSLP